MTEQDPVEVVVHVAAAPDTVFSYFCDEDRYALWMGNEAELEPVPGGVYRVQIREGLTASGEFIVIDRPRFLAFTWGWEGDEVVAPGSSRVELTFAPEGDGTRVMLRHFGLPTETRREGHGKGWQMYLGRLRIRVAGGDPGLDPNA